MEIQLLPIYKSPEWLCEVEWLLHPGLSLVWRGTAVSRVRTKCILKSNQSDLNHALRGFAVKGKEGGGEKRQHKRQRQWGASKNKNKGLAPHVNGPAARPWQIGVKHA